MTVDSGAKKYLFDSERSFLWDLWCDEGYVVVILIFLFFWWALIPYFIFKWSYKCIYRPMDQAKTIKQLAVAVEEAKAQAKTDEEILMQKLTDAAPKTPVTRMRATIFLSNDHDIPSVDMLLELTEEERSIIRTHRLDELEIENVAMHTKEDLARMEQFGRDHVESINPHRDPFKRAIVESSEKAANEMLRSERRRTTVGDLLVTPYRRTFSTPHEAKEFSDKLKAQILPGVRKLIDGYQSYKPAETVEF